MTPRIALWAVGVAIALPALPASATIMIDGAVSPPAEWTSTSPSSVTDLNEAEITDDTVDIAAAHISNGADALNMYLRWDFYEAPPKHTSTGGYVEYGFELYLPGGGILYATNDPWNGGTLDGSTFYLEDATSTAASTGTYAVGTGASQAVEASLPYAALADLGLTIPPAGLQVDYLAYIVEQTPQIDDETPVGTFTIVPEPATAALLAVAVAGLLGRVRRRD